MSSTEQRVVFVSGLSGSGKTTTMAALEDLSFYCADNLPAALTPQFLDLCVKATPPIQKVALALDAREADFLRGIPAVVEDLRREGALVTMIFLECSNDVLVNRYRETRRVHPLAPDGSIEEGIDTERRLLSEVSALADVRIETTDLNVHQLRDTVIRSIAGEARSTVLNLMSFGFRYGVPNSADLLFDVRFLPNPHFEPELRPGTGLDAAVSDYVIQQERCQTLLAHLESLMGFLLPCYDDEGKAYLTVGIGCTGGRHRSVAVAEHLADGFRKTGRDVNLSHRDVEKGP